MVVGYSYFSFKVVFALLSQFKLFSNSRTVLPNSMFSHSGCCLKVSHPQDTVKPTPAKHEYQIWPLFPVIVDSNDSLLGLPVGVAGMGPAGASPYLEAPGGYSTDRQNSRHESLHTVHGLLEPILPVFFLASSQINLSEPCPNTSVLFQAPSFCSPKGLACSLAVSTTNQTGCMSSCTGLYADVVHTEDTALSPGAINKAIQPLTADMKDLVKSIKALSKAGIYLQ